MKFRVLSTVAVFLLLANAAFAVRVGEAAPDFEGKDSNGRSQKLSTYRGKYVVLEWHNNGCPYVQKHYGSGNMQKLQKEWTGKGVVWLTIESSAPGQQGYVTADQENAHLKKVSASPTAAILDPAGQIGRLYSAKTTPHMFIIDPSGKLVYEGAIDDKPTTEKADVATAKNYVTAALTESMGGKPVSTPNSRAYGCSVKYAN